uniref:Conserved oligomeric Golgi complex subunit 2 n=1 Tax=Panagrolaimus sp. PS1159 TaxID=55785 RepID=A0AC35FF74_9BILA
MTITSEEVPQNGRNSPTMFSTQLSTTNTTMAEENLLFDPQMFTTPDFNIDTLMDNIRHQLDLKDIDKQLRQILQHFQYALINLINNDYTQFVELSSSLVALDKSVESLNKEHEASWEDYTTFAKKLSDLYTFFEKQQSIINESRTKEALSVCELNIYLILDEIVQSAKKKQHSWLKYSFSRLNVLNVYLKELEEKSPEKYEEVKDEIKPSLDFLKRSLNPYITFNPEDLVSNYYMLLNIRELDMVEEGINIASKSIIAYSRIDGSVNQKWRHFLDALNNEKQNIVESIKSSKALSTTAKITLQKFYLSSLLASMVTFTQENFEYDFIPSDSEPFQESYLAFHEFYQSFPEYQIYGSYFKKILSFFDISVYIQLWVKDSYKAFIDSATVENVKLLRNDSGIKFNVSENFSSTIQALCSVKTLPGSSSFICQTFYNCLEKYYDFCEDMRDAFGLWNSEQHGQQQENEAENQQWEIMLVLQISMKNVVDEALKMLEKKLYSNRSSSDATYSNFLKYRNAILLQFQALEVQIESFLHTKLFKDFVKHVSMVGNVPKKYRWTKMPFPKDHSDYVISVRSIWENFIKIYGENKLNESKIILAKSLSSALDTFIAKATEVLDTVDKTANVLRQKGKSLSSDASDSDESKMKQQIILDTESFISLIGTIKEANETVEKLNNLLQRAQSN